jgi:hypothetical protein
VRCGGPAFGNVIRRNVPSGDATARCCGCDGASVARTPRRPRSFNLRFARTDHATAVIEFGWLRVAASHHVVDSSMGKRAGCPEWTHSGVLTTFGECCARSLVEARPSPGRSHRSEDRLGGGRTSPTCGALPAGRTRSARWRSCGGGRTGRKPDRPSPVPLRSSSRDWARGDCAASRKRMPSEQMQLSICSCRESLEPSPRSASRRSPPATSASRAAR